MAETRNDVQLLVGTHKGGFRFTSNTDRKEWELHGPFLKGDDVNHLILDLRNEPTLIACVTTMMGGSRIQISRDFGNSWESPESDIKFDENSVHSLKRIWYIAPGNKHEPDALYAGVDPAALFKSEDSGNNWYEINGLTNHPTRDKWQPGMGGMMVHSICIDPGDKNKMHVGISAAGTFYTEDGGQNWEPRNKGVLADFLPDKFPDVGQCVHHMESHPAKPGVLYQQNHCGVYRSDNSGVEWVDISEGLPARFGFPLVIHPHDPDTIYVIPEQAPEFRCPVDGEFAVFRSKNRGEHWVRLDKGLPNKDAYLNIYRHAMTTDDYDPCGIYVGTSTGQILYSRDEGDS
ncbi:exo-alpha-sialidase [candidate division KSB1 bacterium]|nr:exo-alpha-sialidase [candidate division KSB1 bacterium]